MNDHLVVMLMCGLAAGSPRLYFLIMQILENQAFERLELYSPSLPNSTTQRRSEVRGRPGRLPRNVGASHQHQTPIADAYAPKEPKIVGYKGVTPVCILDLGFKKCQGFQLGIVLEDARKPRKCCRF